MRIQLGLTALGGFLLAGTLSACGGASIEANMTYTNALTGEACTPDPATFIPSGDKHQKPVKQEDLPKNPTGIPGDNMDDASSGMTDCLGDGNSGHGDDWKHPECFPRPGCDADGCCEDPSDDDSSDDPSDDGNDGGDDGSDDPSEPPVDCSHLDDACGVGAYEPDTGLCYYLPNGSCVDPDGSGTGDGGSGTGDGGSGTGDGGTGTGDGGTGTGDGGSGTGDGGTGTGDGGSGSGGPGDCSYLNDPCGTGVYEPDTQSCYYLPSGLCDVN